jgi:hypothetical protein
MARAALRWGVRDVAKAARVSPATVNRVENDQGANAATLVAIQLALEQAGVEFVGTDGVRLRIASSGR